MASVVSSRLLKPRSEPLGTRNNKASDEPVVKPQLDPPASYVLSSIGVIRFARGEPRRMTGRRSLDELKRRTNKETLPKPGFSQGCSNRSVTTDRDPSRSGQLECNRRCGDWSAARADRTTTFGWCGPFGEEFAPDIYASATTMQSCWRQPPAVPREGMCREQSRTTRTIATSRCDDDRAEPKPRASKDKTKHTGTRKQAKTHSATFAQQPKWKPLSLDKLLQERLHHPPARRDFPTAQRCHLGKDTAVSEAPYLRSVGPSRASSGRSLSTDISQKRSGSKGSVRVSDPANLRRTMQPPSV